MSAPIHAALKARLTVVAASFSPAIPVAWENRDYSPNGERFMAADIVPAPNQRLTIGGKHREAGTLAITLATALGKGSGEAAGIADAIAAGFPSETLITAANDKSIRITVTPTARQGFADGGYWRTPILIPYEVI